jgi:predicted flavoprotein YhiN
MAEGRAEDERWHVRRDGSRFWASGVVTPLYDDAGCLRGFAKVMRDLTERKRLADALAAWADVPSTRRLAQLTRPERLRLLTVLTRAELPWSGDEGYRKAEVTGGGVSLAEIQPRTLESRRHSGLHLCGELLDAFGPIGGYNFLWAWATGRAAGLGAALGE